MSARSAARYRAAAVCAPGLESVCRAELNVLGIRSKPSGRGLLEFSANARQLYAANVWLRTASRVVVRVATFRATDFPHLQEHALAVPWSRWIPDGFAPRFRISTHHSKLYHTKAIAQRLHQVSRPPSLGEPEQLFIVRVDRNTVTISADSSGPALHHRPWRTRLGEAPLRTTMAAAMVLASAWDPTTGLVDPFCGSGTIPIEAALVAAGLPPGGAREFAFHHWPRFEPGAWASVSATVQAARQRAAALLDGDRSDPLIWASDRDAPVVEAARANAADAEVANLIRFDTRVVSHLPGRTGPGLLAANPPYGKRLGPAQVGSLYRRLGAVARQRLPGYALSIITSDPALARLADRSLRSIATFRHGGLPVQLYHRAAIASQVELAADSGGTARSGLGLVDGADRSQDKAIVGRSGEDDEAGGVVVPALDSLEQVQDS